MSHKIFHKFASLFLALALSLGGFSPVLAAPPANDAFANAEVAGSLPFTDTVDVTEAGNDSGEPQACYFMERTVWYSFTPSENVSLRADTEGSDVTGNVNIYTSTDAEISNLNFVGCTANTGSFNFNAEAGKTYYLQAGSAFGQVGNIQVNLGQIFPPANDNFDNAEAIAALPFNTTVNNEDTTTESGETSHCGAFLGTVWYSFTPSETMAVRADTAGSGIDSSLNVYTSSVPGVSNLNYIGCASATIPFSFYAEAGTTYYLQADSTGFGQTGDLQINLQQVFPPENDFFVQAEEIGSLPFTAMVDVTDTTHEPNEPEYCTFTERTVWYTFTPTETVPVRVDALGGAIPGNVNIFLSTGSSIAELSFIGCANGSGSSNFYAEAGTTYYLQAGPAFGDVGSIQINIRRIFPPANDDFSNAQEITSLPFNDSVNNADATRESEEPQACSFLNNTIWYSFTATADTLVSADLTTSSSDPTPVLSVFQASGPGFGGLNLLNCTAIDQAATFTVQAGITYYFQVGSTSLAGTDLQLTLREVPPAANNNFSNARVIDALPFSDSVDNTAATTEPGEPQHCFSTHTVWYTFTPTVDTTVRVDMLGSSFHDPVFNVYQPTVGFGGLTHITCAGSNDAAVFDARAGVTYYIQAGSVNSEGGDLHINLQEVARPANDDFDNAISVDALPFSDTRETTLASSAADDPTSCSNNGSVWYQFTPANDTTLVVSANTAGSNYQTALSVYTGSRGALDQVPGGCNVDFSSGSRVSFNATGGTTYYLMVSNCCGTGGDGGGDLILSIQEEPVPSNDNFADAATIDSLSSTSDFDITAASVENGEPAPSCGQPAYYTLWYAFTPSETTAISTRVFNQSFNSLLAIYSGTNLNDLTEVTCRTYGGLLTFTATAGQTYYIQVGSFDEASRGTGSLSLEATSALQVNFHYSPSDPSVRDEVRFCDNSFDPGEVGFESFTWDFGDGSTSTDNCAFHRYTLAGEYTVVHTVTTFDGRTGSTSQVIQVSTHDVTITRIDAPDSGRVGQTKNITVTVRNDGNSQPETVTIDLYRSVPGGGYEYVTSLTQTVPTSRRGRATKFIFRYTFTAEDAELGKLVFNAVANIDGLRDSFTQDNELRSQLTTIRRPASYPNYP